MPETTEAYDFRGRTIVDREGEKVGKIDELYYDRPGGQPEWALVSTGLFGTKKSFVPIQSASPAGEDLQVPVSRDQVKDAPRIDADEELSEDEERRLFEHYDVAYTTDGSTTAARAPSSAENEKVSEPTPRATTDTDRHEPARGSAPAGDGHDASGPDADDAMTRSEEELHVGTTQRESGRVRLRKYVVTEEVQRTVPVRREEVRVEREPITDESRDRAMSGADISESEHEVVLHEEEPVVEKRVVPKERVRMDTETHEDQREVSEDVRKEQIEVDDRNG